MRRWAMIAILIFASNVGAEQLPSEVDLRAAYCIPIVAHWISVWGRLANDPVMKESGVQQDIAKIIAEHNEDMRRLQLYIVPRIPHLEWPGMSGALKRGREDRDKLEQYNATCETKCKLPANKSVSLEEACRGKCYKENPLNHRVSTCSDLRWLPF
jgi:hypothetical protein